MIVAGEGVIGGGGGSGAGMERGGGSGGIVDGFWMAYRSDGVGGFDEGGRFGRGRERRGVF